MKDGMKDGISAGWKASHKRPCAFETLVALLECSPSGASNTFDSVRTALPFKVSSKATPESAVGSCHASAVMVPLSRSTLCEPLTVTVKAVGSRVW